MIDFGFTSDPFPSLAGVLPCGEIGGLEDA
jgi:hypothetical protein